MASLDPELRINLERASILVVDGNQQGADILRQLFAAFGVRSTLRASSVAEAMEITQTTELDLIVANDGLPDGTGYDFVHWLRRTEVDPNRFCPALIVSGHTRRSTISKARDCGANFVVAKPVSATVLLERILWVAREKRPFIDTGDYLGPDRRFHDLGPPKSGGRRKGDPKPGAETESQAPSANTGEAEAQLTTESPAA